MSKKNKLITILSVIGMGLVYSTIDSLAVRTVPYNLKGVPSEYIDKESPPAYRIFGATSLFPDNTILYKQEYKDITYYSPKPPSGSEEANGESKKYINWGFWDFPLNQRVYKYGQNDADRLFESSYYYPQVKILKKTLVESTHGKDGENSLDLGYLNPGTVLNVLSITEQIDGKEVFFDLDQIPNMSSGTNVGKVKIKSGNIQFLGTRKNIYFQESANRSRCRNYTDNFKPYSKPLNLYDRGGHNDLVLTSSFEKSSSSRVPDGVTVNGCSISGRYGEWRYLGVNASGTPVLNPYFPEDQLSYRGNASLGTYDWRKTPWDGSDAESKEVKPLPNADLFIKQYQAPTIYDTSDYYKNMKKEKLKILYDKGILNASRDGDINDFVNRVSLLTHPTKESAIFVGQRKAGAWDRSFVIKNDMRDLYIHSIKVIDSAGKPILEGYGDARENSFKQTKEGRLEKGQEYTIQVVLGNAKNLELSVDTLSAQAGVVKNAPKILDKDLPYSMTHEKLGIRGLNRKGGLRPVAGSLSNPFEFPLSVPENYRGRYLDIYGYVGNYHSGVDNLNYKNDEGVVRAEFKENPPPPPPIEKPDLPVDLGDLMAYSIELIDGNRVVYKRDYTGNVSVKNAIVPGKSYKIKYTARYTGEDLWDYKWIEGYYYPVSVWVPGYTNSNGDWVSGHYTTEYRWSPGYWEKDKISEYSVPIRYTVSRRIGKEQADDSMTSSGSFRDSSGSTSIAMRSGTYMYFETNNIVFEHPYLYTMFNINTTNSEINKYTTNDALFAELNDKFDIEIKNLRLLPSTEYSDGSSREMSYNVIYDAYLNIPSYVSKQDYQANVDTSININGTVFRVIDQLTKGENKDITHFLEGVKVSGKESNIKSEVVLNYNFESYEDGNYDNNRASAVSKMEKVKNPNTGNPSDKASSINNSNNNSNPNRGGDANNNCLVPRTQNIFTSKYNIHKWNSNKMTYSSFNNKTISFNKYYTEGNNSETASNKESLEILEVMFRSKDTRDKKLGENKDGWVNLSKSKEKDLGQIKAGYGFELKIVTEYKTNALLNNPKWSTNKDRGTSVTNLSSGVNIIPDIFVELPGDKNNRKILSVSGYESSIKGLVAKQIKSGNVEGGQQVYRWEYTIKPSTTVGVSEVGKVFIPQNLKDGTYKLSIYTPPVTGVSSLPEYNTSKYSALCDRKDVNVKVKGSATDDLNSHVTQ